MWSSKSGLILGQGPYSDQFQNQDQNTNYCYFNVVIYSSIPAAPVDKEKKIKTKGKSFAKM